jgi:hypothetical protein
VLQLYAVLAKAPRPGRLEFDRQRPGCRRGAAVGMLVALGLEGNRQRVAFVGPRSLVLDVAPAQEEMEARTLMPVWRPAAMGSVDDLSKDEAGDITTSQDTSVRELRDSWPVVEHLSCLACVASSLSVDSHRGLRPGTEIPMQTVVKNAGCTNGARQFITASAQCTGHV